MSRNVSYRGEKRPDVSEKFYTEGERGPGPVGNILPSKETLKRIHIKCGDVSLPGRRLEGPPPPPQDFFISREAGEGRRPIFDFLLHRRVVEVVQATTSDPISKPAKRDSSLDRTRLDNSAPGHKTEDRRRHDDGRRRHDDDRRGYDDERRGYDDRRRHDGGRRRYDDDDGRRRGEDERRHDSRKKEESRGASASRRDETDKDKEIDKKKRKVDEEEENNVERRGRSMDHTQNHSPRLPPFGPSPRPAYPPGPMRPPLYPPMYPPPYHHPPMYFGGFGPPPFGPQRPPRPHIQYNQSRPSHTK
ncbi:WW domain-binding protein 11 isoform X1 [Frankliniella occidentalis]|uniref:WW domain-binding protein 11 isoform X1 n=1 Tax=Frankliniella occidentalis TaxID=133901 RepID=A0A6J1SQY6_FRAOC|nr:WW domain-binding protein 11 isoform X1 [Frankliniella occidentalis]